MVTRRQVMASAVGAFGLGANSRVTGQTQTQAPADSNAPILTEILSELRASRMPDRFPGAHEIELIRQSRRLYLKQTGRFPDAIDVGYDVWESVFDWFVATGRPIEATRLPTGHYFFKFLETNIVLKPELPDGYVGQGLTDR
jgi:hypothetical protein